VRQNLDSHQPFETRVLRPIDFAHPTGADERDDFVGAEARASRQRHESRLILATEGVAAKGKRGEDLRK
jgi:hypothetical protein